jgi:hypothetical protein
MNFQQKYCQNNQKYLGFLQFCFDFLPQHFNRQYGVAPFHVRILKKFLEDRPEWIKEDRCFANMMFRNSAKTTFFALAVPTYFACFNGNIKWENYTLPPMNYVVLKSKSDRAAKKLLLAVYGVLMSKKIVGAFGKFNPTIKEVRDEKLKSASDILITKRQFMAESLSLGQQIRGIKLFEVRPIYAVYDDVEDSKNTITEESRDKNKEDLWSETFGAIEDKTGRVVVNGNMVHPDCLIKSLYDNPEWKSENIPLSWIDKDGVEHSSWEKKFPMKDIGRKRKFYFSAPKLGARIWFRDYYNKIINDIQPKFICDLEWKYRRCNRVNFIEKKNEFRNIFIGIGYDPAQSEKKWSSDSAMAVHAMDCEGRVYLMDYFLGKLNLHDQYYDGYEPIFPFALNEEDLKKVRRRGGIEEVCRWIVKFNADSFCVETASQQRGIYDDIQQRLDRTTPDFLASKGFEGRSLRTVIGLTYTPHIEKIQKLSSSVMRNFEMGYYTCLTDKKDIQNIINAFPHAKLDLLDAMFLADKTLMRPIKVEYQGIESTIKVPIKNGIQEIKLPEEDRWIAR